MTLCRKILIVAAASLRASLLEPFRRHPEFVALEADIDTFAPERLARLAPDLLILEDGAPGDLVAQIRSAGFAGPLLLLGGGAEPDPPEGRTERLARPFRFVSLLARVRAHLASSAETTTACATLGAYRFRPGAAELSHHAGGTLRLTEKESAILSRLVRAGGEAVAKDMLLREIWGYHPGVTSRTLETHIYRLRRKLEPDSSAPRLLVTEKNGYRLICSVTSPPRAEH